MSWRDCCETKDNEIERLRAALDAEREKCARVADIATLIRASSPDIDRESDLVREIKLLGTALERAQKFIKLGNHPNADDLLAQIEYALGH